ncbi:uncharacterized protein DS421_13g392260 [Arachis hypogaea]|nr:uncharacterized protein DS421_13g392260 [Arachis hypogaea]
MPLHDRIMPYLERAGLYHLARLNAHWFWLDEPLVSAFIERWRPETHTFHMPFGECTVTLQDVAYQLGLPVDEQPVSGCMTDFHLHIEGDRPAWGGGGLGLAWGDAAICIWSESIGCSTWRSASDQS